MFLPCPFNSHIELHFWHNIHSWLFFIKLFNFPVISFVYNYFSPCKYVAYNSLIHSVSRSFTQSLHWFIQKITVAIACVPATGSHQKALVLEGWSKGVRRATGDWMWKWGIKKEMGDCKWQRSLKHDRQISGGRIYVSSIWYLVRRHYSPCAVYGMCASVSVAVSVSVVLSV